MKPLVVLFGTFALSVLVLYFFGNPQAMQYAGRIGMSAMLLFTAIGHFAFTRGMSMMLPEWVPGRRMLVYLTGLLEIVAAIGLQIADAQVTTGWLLIVFFMMLLPANIYAALKRVDYEKGTYEGNGTGYLWFRVPLQVLFIAWSYWSAVVVTP